MIIEYYSPHKKIIVKAIAMLVVVSFLWYDIAWAADLFYYVPPKVVDTNSASNLPKDLSKDLPKDSVVKEVTNYDLLDSMKGKGGFSATLPSQRDKAQSSKFAPGYVQEQQAKHEEIVGQKQDIENLDLLRAKPRRADESVDLKKKKSGGGGGSSSPADWSMTEPGQQEDPHNFNEFVNPSNLSQIKKYDITMMDIQRWMQANPGQFKDDKGVIYWLGSGGGSPEGDRLIMTITYEGEGVGKRIKSILTGYRVTESGLYEAKYRVDYTYSGSDLSETRKYDTSGGGDRLVEKSVYEGSGDGNRLKKTVYYGKFGDVVNRRDYVYNASGAITEALLYETNSEVDGEGKLIQKTAFKGEKSKELADYTENYYTDPDTGVRYTTETTVYYYSSGKRASQTSGQDYRYSKTRQVTYKGSPFAIDTNGDGKIDAADGDANGDGILDNARKSSMIVFDDTNRLADEEVADYMVIYSGENNAVTQTVVYFYKD
ncbi:MAG: hypothetical protein WCK38_02910, partial [Candidatus Omnitrophota bacterium]